MRRRRWHRRRDDKYEIMYWMKKDYTREGLRYRPAKDRKNCNQRADEKWPPLQGVKLEGEKKTGTCAWLVERLLAVK